MRMRCDTCNSYMKFVSNCFTWVWGRWVPETYYACPKCKEKH